MIFLDYIYNKVYAPVEDDFGFDDAGDMDELDDELQVEEGTAASGEGGDELYEHWKVQVDANQDPVRIDKYLADKMAYQSRNRIQQAADAGFIHVNGKPVKSNYKVRPNDLVTLMLDRPRHETSIKPEEIAINVVYEDDQLMVVNKEAGMVVHPGAGNFHGTLIQAVAWHLRDMPEFDANDPEVGLVHRIDKDTSGLDRDDGTHNNVGPGEFLGLIKNAELILTDSFHGTVFSIIYHKPFYTFSRTGVKESMDTRVVSLLKLLELTDRFEPENITLDGVEQIDFGKSKIILDREKKRAIEYIEGISK
mgnify:CR=1 FL=1